jgi:hypothetical protein
MTDASAPLTPFTKALFAWADSLPAPLRRQFLDPPRETGFRMKGRMSRVWHRPFWIWPFLWMASQVNMIFAEGGRDVPVRLIVRQDLAGGRPVQSWRRAFRFGRTRRSFDATITCDDQGVVLERMGPFSMLELAWAVGFDAPDTVTIDGHSLRLRIWRWRVQVPGVLFGRVVASQTATGRDTVSLRLCIRHPLLGDVFGYEGELTIVDGS